MEAQQASSARKPLPVLATSMHVYRLVGGHAAEMMRGAWLPTLLCSALTAVYLAVLAQRSLVLLLGLLPVFGLLGGMLVSLVYVRWHRQFLRGERPAQGVALGWRELRFTICTIAIPALVLVIVMIGLAPAGLLMLRLAPHPGLALAFTVVGNTVFAWFMARLGLMWPGLALDRPMTRALAESWWATRGQTLRVAAVLACALVPAAMVWVLLGVLPPVLQLITQAPNKLAAAAAVVAAAALMELAVMAPVVTSLSVLYERLIGEPVAPLVTSSPPMPPAMPHGMVDGRGAGALPDNTDDDASSRGSPASADAGTSKPPLPVAAVAAEAYGLVRRHAGDLAYDTWLPVLLITLCYYAPALTGSHTATGIMRGLQMLGMGLLYSLVHVRWYATFMAEEQSATALATGKRVLRYFGYGTAIFLLLYIPVTLVRGPIAAAAKEVLSADAVLAILVLVLFRTGPSWPDIALGRPARLLQSWRITRGHGARIAGLAVLAFMPMILAGLLSRMIAFVIPAKAGAASFVALGFTMTGIFLAHVAQFALSLAGTVIVIATLSVLHRSLAVKAA